MAAVAAMRAAQRKKEQVRQEAEANKREREKARAHDHHGTSGSLDAEGFVNELMEDTTQLDLNEGYGDKMSDMFKVMPIFLTNTLKTAEDVEVAEQAEADGGGLTPEIAEEVYRSMNTDGSAGLDKEELRQGLEKMNLPNVNRIMAYQLFKTADANGDGLIDLGEFQDLIATIQAGSMETDVARMRAPGPASALMNLPPARAAAACVARARDAFVASFPGTCAGYARLAARAKAVAEGERFDQLIIFCIMLVGVATFVQMEFNRDGEASAGVRLFLDVVGYVTLAVFTVEVVVKIVARGDAPAGFFTDPPRARSTRSTSRSSRSRTRCSARATAASSRCAGCCGSSRS